VVSGGEDGYVCITNVGVGKLTGAYQGHNEGEQKSIEDLEFLSFLPCVATASLDKTVKIWDLNTFQTRSTLKHSEGAVRVRTSAKHPNILTTCCLDGTISVWDARAGTIINKFTGHTAPVLDIAVNDTTIISGSEDQTIRLWDMGLKDL